MFIQNYISENKFKMLCTTYEENYIKNLDYKKFIEIYNLFVEYKFYFIDDIILNYLEIFQMNINDVRNAITKLQEQLGKDFVYIIGSDMRYLEFIYQNK